MQNSMSKSLFTNVSAFGELLEWLCLFSKWRHDHNRLFFITSTRLYIVNMFVQLLLMVCWALHKN